MITSSDLCCVQLKMPPEDWKWNWNGGPASAILSSPAIGCQIKPITNVSALRTTLSKENSHEIDISVDALQRLCQYSTNPKGSELLSFCFPAQCCLDSCSNVYYYSTTTIDVGWIKVLIDNYSFFCFNSFRCSTIPYMGLCQCTLCWSASLTHPSSRGFATSSSLEGPATSILGPPTTALSTP